MWYIKNRISDEYFVSVCKESKSMSIAASKLKLHFNSFKKRAIELNCYFPNQSGKGISKSYNGKNKISLKEILEGNHPSYQTFKLKNRILKEGIFENKCDICGINEWIGKPLNCHLHHIDGDRTNHIIHNLRMLCPNCHSQTDTYTSKK